MTTASAQPIASAPKDKTIIVTGGWYINPFTGVRIDGLPAYVDWDTLTAAWVMQDDHHSVYHEPKQWVAA